MTLTQNKIAFIGSGNMAQALIMGLLKQSVLASHLCVAGRNAEKLMELHRQWQVPTTLVNAEAVTRSDILILCVKPQQLRAVCDEIKEAVQKNKPLVISIATGVTLTLLQKWLGEDIALVRAMPNTPVTVGSGVTGFTVNKAVTTSRMAEIKALFDSVGSSWYFENEQQMDAVTAVSGCGPAYVYLFIEALQNAAIAAGLDEKAALAMTEQTVLGAAQWALQSEKKAAVLRREVASPGGATEQGLKALEEGGLRALVVTAVNAALARAKEMTRQLQ